MKALYVSLLDSMGNEATFEKYLADHPNATQQELWDAAFVAGHQTAHTLLTGEPQ